MEKKLKRIISVTAFLLSQSGSANAAVVVSNLSLTSNSITFDLTGTLDGPLPSTFEEQFFITAATGSFMLDRVQTVTAVTFSTTNPNSLFDFSTLNLSTRYPFTLATAATSSYVVGDDVTGTYTATWRDNQFDPSGGATLDFHWGAASRYSTNPPTGTEVALGVPIPEPAPSLFSLLAFTATLRRRRRT